MRITKISVYSVDLPYPGGVYRLSKGRSYTSFDDTIVSIETDAGITGWGETCPFGSTYVAASAEGARTAIRLIAPRLLGVDPRRPEPVYQLMDSILTGHGYAKAALDMACWDVLGKSVGLPLCDLWGSRFETPLKIGDSLQMSDPENMKTQLRRLHQGKSRDIRMKASGDVVRDIEILDLITSSLGSTFTFTVDANAGWSLGEALRIAHALHDRHIIFEQPCATYEECRLLRQRIPHSIVLDEVAIDVETAIRARNDGLLARYNLQTAKVGGLSKARKIRDFCVELKVPIIFQCTWGAELTKAGLLHLAQSTPKRWRTEFWNITDSVGIVTGDGTPDAVDGMIEASYEPGLGIRPRLDVLGKPVAVYE